MWSTFLTRDVLGSHLNDDQERHDLTANTKRYHVILQNFALLEHYGILVI